MTEQKITLGQAIDKIVEALQSIDETSRPTVLATVCAHLGIPAAAAVAMKPSMPATVATSLQALPQHTTQAVPAPVDIRTLKSQKQPSTAQQMACLVAYYLQDIAPENERKATISADDLDKYFKQAGYKLPKKMDQVLPDSKKTGYFESVARGDYRLTAVGYNLVVHNLPPQPSK
jgi:hypothetical protein